MTDMALLPPEPIVRFIKKHHVLTLATVGDDGPWCSNVFYAYIPAGNIFVFTSSDSTRHGRQMLDSSRVAASVVLETRVVGRVQGLQLTGVVERVSPEAGEYRAAYLRRFPYAVVADLELWTLRPLEMKLTDNTLGFGKKIAWVAPATPD